MNVSKDNNNGLEASNGGDRGVTPHSRVRPLRTDTLFIIGSSFNPNKKKLYKYFPLLVGRSSKSLYQLLGTVYAYPLRTVNGLNTVCISNPYTIKKNVKILIDLGYVQQEHKPRRIIPLNSFTVDDVFRITSKGLKVLSEITGY